MLRNGEAQKAIAAAHFSREAPRFCMMQQVHGAEVLIVEDDKKARSGASSGDGLITATPGIALTVMTADCVPILLFEPHRKVIAALHAGWRGTAANIVAKAVALMQTRFGATPTALVAAIGPAIGACCYEVDEAVRSRLARYAGDAQAGCFTASLVPSRWMLDLKAINRLQLLEAGLIADNVDVSPLCTACEASLFFSHRRDKGKTGRMFNFIALKNTALTSASSAQSTPTQF